MTERLNAIIVEDSLDDAEVMVKVLRSEGFELNSIVVDSPSGLREALAGQIWDIIITDHVMPSFDAWQVLDIVREEQSIVPVIIVSGWIDINTAVRLMKSGARDYVQKEELARLPRAVQNALHEAQLENANRAMVQALAESERRLADILDCLPDATLVINEQGKVILWNRAMEKMTGCSREQMIGRDNYEYALPFYGERRPMLIDLALLPEGESEPIRQEYNFVRWDGDTLLAEAYVPSQYHGQGAYLWGSASKLYDSQGHSIGAIQSVRDISERKHYENALYKWMQVFDHADWGIVVCDRDECRIEMVNPAFARMHGRTVEELKNKTIFELYGSEVQPALRQRINQAREKGHSFFETSRIAGGEAAFPASVDIMAVKDEKGRVLFLIGNVQDITGRKQTELERDSLRFLMKTIINSMPSMVAAVDMEGRVIQWNAEAERRTGISCEAAAGQPISRILPSFGQQIPGWELALTEQRTIHEHRVNLSRDGLPGIADVMIYPLAAGSLSGAVVRIDDITERVRLEETIIQTEKMISLGGLAAGMAHEINNPLSGILQAAQNIGRRLAMDMDKNRGTAERLGLDPDALEAYMSERQVAEFVVSIQTAGARASSIINNMLQFSRRSISHQEPVDLASLVDRTLELAANDYDLDRHFDFRHIRILRDYSPELPQVSCTSNEIEQVVFNLLQNAAHAMFENPRQAEEPRISLRVFQDQQWAVIEVEDNGPGMDEQTRKRIFEPFFTTRSNGSGTGLGLSVSYFIIQDNHNGELAVESSPGKGARFIIRLPLPGSCQK